MNEQDLHKAPVEPDRSFPDQIARAENAPVSTEFSEGTARRTKKAARTAAIILLAFFAVVMGIQYFHARAVARATLVAASAPPPVEVVIARAPSMGAELVLPGETAAWYETTIYARVNGYVAKWFVDIGDHLKKDQVLAIIETPELDAELQAARAQLKASEAQLEARKAEAEFGKTTNERWRDAPKGVVSEQERDSKKADYESAQARLYAASAQVSLDQSKVAQFRTLAEFKQVRAPFDGTITERRIDVGNLVTAGSTSTTSSLYRMAQTDPLRVFVDVPQSAAADLMSPGIAAQIRTTGAGGGVFDGTTARSAQSISAQARTMRVEVDIPNARHALVPGMYVNVAFRLTVQGLIEVPAAALIFRPTGPQVAKVDRNGKINFADVTIARDNGSMVELSAGVHADDRLVLNISNRIGAGQAVAIATPPAALGAVALAH
jgi:RND family efflux transporter MFP subunit